MFSRDGFSGRIDTKVFLAVMDLYGEILQLDAYDKLELLQKLQVINGVEEDKRNNQPRKSPSNTDEDTPTLIGGKRR